LDLTIGLMLGLGVAVALFATHRRERHVVEHYRNVDQKFYERWQAYCQLQRLIEEDAQDQETKELSHPATEPLEGSPLPTPD
jgi:hypothetical protein